MEGDDCTEDYIVIPDNGKNNNRYCGSGLSNIVSKFRDNNNYGLMRLRHMGWRRLKMISFFFQHFNDHLKYSSILMVPIPQLTVYKDFN